MTNDGIAASFLRKKKRLGITWENYHQREKNFFRVRVNDELRESVRDWCNERFGDEWIWSDPVHTDYMDVFFLREEHALLFKLSFDTISVS